MEKKCKVWFNVALPLKNNIEMWLCIVKIIDTSFIIVSLGWGKIRRQFPESQKRELGRARADLEAE